MRKKQNIQWVSLSCLLSMVWMLVKGDDSPETRPPRLNVTDSFLDVEFNSTLTLECSGEKPLAWGFIDPRDLMYKDKSFQKVNAIPTNYDYDDKSFKSIIQITFTDYLETGIYVCYYIGSSTNTSLYIFVNDESQLLLPPKDNYISFFEGEPSLLPCLPSNSRTKVSLCKSSENHCNPVPMDTSKIEYSPRSGFLLKNPNNKSFAGLFYCIAEFQNKTQEELLHIRLYKKPSRIPQVTIDDKNAKYVLIHTNFTIKCIVVVESGIVVNKIEWFHPANKVKMGNKKPQKGKSRDIDTYFKSLTIINTQKSDEGVYRCNATDLSGLDNSAEIAVKIYEKPLPPVVNFTQSHDIIIMEKGEDVKLTACYSVFPPTSNIQPIWTKNSVQLLTSQKYTMNATATSFILKIFNLSRLDTGKYSVIAHTTDGSYNRTFELFVKDSPIVRIQNSSCCYIPGSNNLLSCEAEGYPPPSITWHWMPLDYYAKNSSELYEKWIKVENGTKWAMARDDGTVLSILQATAIKSGFYKCQTQNEIGTAEEKIQFIVSDLDSGFTIETSDEIPLVMDSWSITCKASSDMFSSLKMNYKRNETENSTEIPDFLLKKIITSEFIGVYLHFDAIRKNESGIYTCVGDLLLENGSTNKFFFINVREPQEPRFVLEEWDLEIEIDPYKVLRLDCEVTGVPTPIVSWYWNGELQIHNITGVYLMENSQRLIVDRPSEENSGQYSCVADNGIGVIMRNVSVSVSASHSPSAVKGSQDSNQRWKNIAVGLVVGVLFILLVCAAVIVYRRKRRQIILQSFNHQLFKDGQMGFYDPSIPLDDQVDLLPYDPRWEFPKENLKFGRTLGQGAFGRVIKAEAIGLNDYETSTSVAVKMLKEKSDINQQKALIAELKILIHLGHHVNIVNLMGAVTKNISQGELYVMVEYCRYGNLRYYLLRHRESFVSDTNDLLALNSTTENYNDDSNNTMMTEIKSDVVPCSTGSSFAVDNPNYSRQRFHSVSSDPRGGSSSGFRSSRSTSFSSNSGRYYCRVDSHEHVITTSDLICFAFQCASGMEYLTSKKLIHRDLAARNVLLADDKIVKICDFGLAKDCYKYENYVKKGDGPLPIKWMAIESIRDHLFTSKSDVWSFGILMWEFFTLGNNPYPGIEIDEEFYKRLNTGYRLEKPDHCPDNVYQMMQSCWQAHPDDRPDFNQLSFLLGALLEAGVKQHYIDLNGPYMEMNCKSEKHDYSNTLTAESSQVPSEYMNSGATSWYDSLPSESRSIFSDSVSREPTDSIPMIQLETIEENDVFESEDFQKQKDLHSTDYLQMGEGKVFDERSLKLAI